MRSSQPPRSLRYEIVHWLTLCSISDSVHLASLPARAYILISYFQHAYTARWPAGGSSLRFRIFGDPTTVRICSTCIADISIDGEKAASTPRSRAACPPCRLHTLHLLWRPRVPHLLGLQFSPEHRTSTLATLIPHHLITPFLVHPPVPLPNTGSSPSPSHLPNGLHRRFIWVKVNHGQDWSLTRPRLLHLQHFHFLRLQTALSAHGAVARSPKTSPPSYRMLGSSPTIATGGTLSDSHQCLRVCLAVLRHPWITCRYVARL